jgi:hypothetical protein
MMGRAATTFGSWRIGCALLIALVCLHAERLFAQALPNHLLTERPAPVQSMPAQPMPTRPAPVQRAPAQARPATNLLMQAGQTLGFHRCASALDQISDRVLAGTRKHDIVLDWDRAHPDSGPFFSLTGMQFPTVSALLSLSIIPQENQSCAILVERISSAPIACHEVARSELAGYKATALVQAVTVYTSPAHTHEVVTLVDTPPACVIVRRQVEYGWPASPP